MRWLYIWLILICMSFPAIAGTSFHDDKHSLTLISGYDSTGTLTTVSMGLHFNFEDKWKTYWRDPGVVGYPIKIDASGSKNVKTVVIHWPTPQEFTTFNLKSYGYSHDIVLPLTVVLNNPGEPAEVNLKLDYLVCDPAHCLRRQTTLSLTLNPKDEAGDLVVTKSKDFNLIKSYLDQVPRPDTGVNMTIERVELDTSPADHHLLTVVAHNPNGFKSPRLFIEPHADIYVHFTQATFSADKTKAVFVAKVYLNERMKKPPDISILNKQIRLTLNNQDNTIDAIRFVQEPKSGVKAFLLVSFLAFLGGFILNFMPCVLPVISIKVLSVFQQSGVALAQIRRNFLLTVLGILTSFWFIALLAISFKEVGYAVGWGVQFQDPLFLIGIMLVIALFAYNLLGWFEILLSTSVATKLTEAEMVEHPLSYFLSGAFVTILATPCTAPFLGTALSFAFSRGNFEILSIFTVMGFGLALPFLLISFFPRLATKLPKPGPWIITFKKSLSLLLFATLVWLLWAFYLLVGLPTTIVLIIAIILIGVILYLKSIGQVRSLLAWLIVILLTGSAFMAPYAIDPVRTEKNLAGTIWQKFDEKKIQTYVLQGKVVFVDVTAEWCLTCKANELLILDRKEIKDELGSDDVVAMLADWTDGNEQITTFLRRFGKYGVPFYAVFGPGVPDGMPLPEVLTTQIVKDAIESARKK